MKIFTRQQRLTDLIADCKKFCEPPMEAVLALEKLDPDTYTLDDLCRAFGEGHLLLGWTMGAMTCDECGKESQALVNFGEHHGCDDCGGEVMVCLSCVLQAAQTFSVTER